jgi:hypothetical protein
MARKFYIEDNVTPPAVCFELSQPSGFSEITDENQLSALYENEYSKRASDGQAYYNKIRTQIYRDFINGLITDVQAFDLENHINGVAENLFTGNWLTAKNTNANLLLSGVYDQALKDEINDYITNYLSENY